MAIKHNLETDRLRRKDAEFKYFAVTHTSDPNKLPPIEESLLHDKIDFNFNPVHYIIQYTNNKKLDYFNIYNDNVEICSE